MAISFNQIPANLRVPIAYFEIDSSQAASYSQVTYALILGTHAPARGPLQIGVLTRVRSKFDGEGLCGVGSALARMCAAYFQNNQSVPLFILAAAETGFTAGAGAFTVDGTPTEGGTLPLYIGGRAVRAYLTAGMTTPEVLDAIEAAVNADPAIGAVALADATATVPEIAITSTQPGLHGTLSLDVAFRGPAYGEIVPLGLTVAATPMTGAAGVPNMSALIANLGDELYDYICTPWDDATSLDDLAGLLQDVTGRWSWSQQLYGHAFAFRNDTHGALSTFGNSRNDQHVTLAGWFGSPTPSCEIAAAWTGQVAGSIVVDPARPVQTLPLLGVVPPRPDDRFQILDRQVLYFDGIACGYVDSGGVMRIDRSITTYQKNVWGAPDNSYLDVETLYTLAYFNRFMRNRILLKFPRHKLADNETRFGAGQAIVTPDIIRSEMIAAYGELEVAGIMENMEAFKSALVVERNAQDPNRVDALLPPDLVNQLRIFAALNQFRLRSVSVEAA
jgi:phage tail sheath gpL-like